MAGNIPIQKLLQEHLPTYVWMTCFDIYAFLEQLTLDEDGNERFGREADRLSLNVVLCRMTRLGEFETRPVRKEDRRKYVSESDFGDHRNGLRRLYRLKERERPE